MAIMRVNPTRMELTRLKKRLVVARRGNKLLKDKQDELMKKFLDLVKKNKELREKVEDMLMKVHENFLIARAVMSSESRKCFNASKAKYSPWCLSKYNERICACF